ncbi:ORF167 [Staphylococcus phage 55]|uniref:ORF167 n=4 Tax=Azeredovirinae TaxID=2842522 RepID=Q4ZB67_9CAUD|nr:ORF168 [Staphylococcus phage ROSA]YP_240509.1 ORF167 [Staphylococcus phage 55]AAX90829.1 ORF160 [Staphylococcus phage 69]AAX91641.1 ORF174 [Staphylococcus phage 71]AAX91566.1 ORF168 [Staphylococcus phage ROSA]AAX91716.1 ORF167 [Staphylococcus phage 55]
MFILFAFIIFKYDCEISIFSIIEFNIFNFHCEFSSLKPC